MSRKVGRNDACPCGSGRKYKKCCLDSQRGQSEGAPTQGFGQLYQYVNPEELAPDELVLLLETPLGLATRRVPSASPLREQTAYGTAAEAATHDAAAVWGLPDFTYRPKVRRLPSGSRELGDGFLVVGDLGIVVQVKAREAPSGDGAKELRWLGRKTADAIRQGSGTIRALRRTPATLINARDREVEVNGRDLRWLIAVVIEHPEPPEGFCPAIAKSAIPAVVLLRRDWEFLFNQLKSTHAVGEYFERTANDPVELGKEPVRYVELAVADAETEPEPPHSSVADVGEVVSAPLLPMQPAASEDIEGHLMVRTIFEEIATTLLRDATESDRLRALGQLDRLYVAHRGEVGRFLIAALEEVADVPEPELLWRLRSIRGGPRRAHLAFGACSRFSNDIQGAFSAWVQLRHHELQQETSEIDELTTVGVLLTPRHDGVRPWDTTMTAVAGDLELTDDELRVYRSVWGHVRDAVGTTTVR